METNQTNPGIILQRMGVEVGPDDPRSAEEILNQINRTRIDMNIQMEPDQDIRVQMAAFAILNYPLESEKAILNA